MKPIMKYGVKQNNYPVEQKLPFQKHRRKRVESEIQVVQNNIKEKKGVVRIREKHDMYISTLINIIL